ncbi:TldD/PmbA family protein [bacterium]|nr:TldD/PmbA family protein [candidate division CSSED10-310 bacterium]
MKSFLQSVIKKHEKEVDYLEIRVEESESTTIGFRGPGIDGLKQSSERGGCVRALYKGGWGFATFNKLTEESVDYYIQSAVKQACLVGKDKSRLAPVPTVVVEIPLDIDNDPRDIPLARKVDILSSYNKQILEAHKLIPMSSVRYAERHSHKWFCNSEGSYIDQEHMDIGGGLVPVALKDGQTQMASVGFGSSRDFNVLLGKEKELEAACRHAVDLLEAPSIEGGIYTVVVDPVLAGVFVHESFGHTSEGEKVFDNENLAKVMKMGRQFGKPVLNIYDSGQDIGCRGYVPFDDEGVRTEKTYLIREGQLVGRLHSRETAGRMGEKATGNGRALNYKYVPIPRMRNTCIEQGHSTIDDMIRGIKLGVYAVDAMGGQGGEMFTFTAGRGYMIRDGKIEEMVKNVTMSGNLFKTLENIDMVGNDFQIHDSGGGCGKGAQFPLPVSHGAPHIRIQNAVIAGSR